MKVHELVAILQNVDQSADARMVIGFHDADLEEKHIEVSDGNVSIEISDFANMVEDYCEILGAL